MNLSQVSRAELVRNTFDLSQLARTIADDLSRRDPERQVAFTIEGGLIMCADRRLMQIVLENLFGNAWKFTSKTTNAAIDFAA